MYHPLSSLELVATTINGVSICERPKQKAHTMALTPRVLSRIAAHGAGTTAATAPVRRHVIIRFGGPLVVGFKGRRVRTKGSFGSVGEPGEETRF